MKKIIPLTASLLSAGIKAILLTSLATSVSLGRGAFTRGVDLDID